MVGILIYVPIAPRNMMSRDKILIALIIAVSLGLVFSLVANTLGIGTYPSISSGQTFTGLIVIGALVLALKART